MPLHINFSIFCRIFKCQKSKRARLTLGFYSFECLNHSNVTFEMSYTSYNDLTLEVSIIRDLEGRRVRKAQIYVCVLLYFLLKVAAFDVPS